jgi:lipoate-protein ligase A
MRSLVKSSTKDGTSKEHNKDLKMESIAKDMSIMVTVNNINYEKLVSLLFSSYRARAENLMRLGIIPESVDVNDLKWLILLFLQDRGYISDITGIRMSREMDEHRQERRAASTR